MDFVHQLGLESKSDEKIFNNDQLTSFLTEFDWTVVSAYNVIAPAMVSVRVDKK